MVRRSFLLVSTLLITLLVTAFFAQTVNSAHQSVLVVTTTQDDHDGACDSDHCSLREALEQAHKEGSGGHIQLPANQEAYVLSEEPLEISKRIRLEFTGEGFAGIDAQYLFPISCKYVVENTRT